MQRKVELAVQRIAATLKSWKAIDAITLMEVENDVYDPYFFLSLDAYARGPIPEPHQRREAFAYAGAFESSGVGRKDRFFLDDMPVRVEYKDVTRFNAVVDGAVSDAGSFRESGTYSFYRLEHGTLLFSRTDWIAEIRGKLGELPQVFWDRLRASHQAKLEHYLSDMGAAVARDDDYFFLASLSGFLKSLCSVLFALNRTFEPADRHMAREVLALHTLPEPFRGRFEMLAASRPELTPYRKREIAELVTRSVIRL